MRRVVFTGAAGAGAAQVVAGFLAAVESAAEPWEAEVLAPRPTALPGATVRTVDLVGTDLTRALGDADAVVHLGGPVDDQDPSQLAAARLVDEARVVLAAAARGVARGTVRDVVVVSSAVVLGALSSNPVPLTEQAVVHPAPEFRPAVELAEIERIAAEYRADCTDGAACLTVLRAAPVVAEGAPGWLAAEMHRSLAYPVDGGDPGFQYLHATDLGAAVATVLAARPGGIVHVAPDGSLPGPERRALETRPRLRVPEPVADAAASLRSVARGSTTPEGVRPYLAQEWSLANDRLRSLGWEPRYANDEAYVAAFRPAPWSMIPSGRRQELLLGGVGAAAAGLVVGAGVLLRRRHR